MRLRFSTYLTIAFLAFVSPFSFSDGLLDKYFDLVGVNNVANAALTGFAVLEMPAGSRRDAMGGAYTAVDDVSGFFDGNPSATAGNIASTLSIYHHEWIADSAIESLVFARSYGAVGIGGAARAFRVPFTSYDNVGGRNGTGHIAEVVAAVNLSVLFVDLTQLQASVGANVKGVMHFVSSGIETGRIAFSVPVDLGLQLRFRFLPIRVEKRRNVSVGASLRNFGQKNSTLDANLPTQFAAGVAYSPFDAILVSGDFIVPITFEPEASPAEPFYGSTGLSVSATRFFDIHAGARIRAGDFRMTLGASINLGVLSFVTTYTIAPANGLNPEESLSVAMSLDMLETVRQ